MKSGNSVIDQRQRIGIIGNCVNSDSCNLGVPENVLAPLAESRRWDTFSRCIVSGAEGEGGVTMTRCAARLCDCAASKSLFSQRRRRRDACPGRCRCLLRSATLSQGLGLCGPSQARACPGLTLGSPSSGRVSDGVPPHLHRTCGVPGFLDPLWAAPILRCFRGGSSCLAPQFKGRFGFY